VAEASIADRHRRGLFGTRTLEDCLKRYREALDQGLLKIMSKMGIAVISSYRGGGFFEALGLSRTMVAEYFPDMPSRISGIGMVGIQRRVLELHRRAWSEDYTALPVGGFYRFRRGGEAHAWEAGLIHMLQSAVATESYQTFKRYSEAMEKRPPIAIRDLLAFDHRPPSPSTRWNRSPRSASASTPPACPWARSRPRPMAPSTSP
jgi:Glutamate synthase domain 2